MHRVTIKFIPWLLTHDHFLVEFLAKNGIIVFPHLVYLLIYPQQTFSCFSKLKFSLRGRRFQSTVEIQDKSQTQFRAITENEFHGANEWKKRWERCVACNGKYFERDKYLYSCKYNNKDYVTKVRHVNRHRMFALIILNGMQMTLYSCISASIQQL